MRRCVLLFVLTAALIGCGGAAPTATMAGCATSDGKQVYGVLESYSKQWEAAANRADTAALAALPQAIDGMRAVRNDLNGQQFPACGKATQSAFVTVMDTTIAAFTAEQEQKKADSDALFAKAREQQEALKAEVQKLPR